MKSAGIITVVLLVGGFFYKLPTPPEEPGPGFGLLLLVIILLLLFAFREDRN